MDVRVFDHSIINLKSYHLRALTRALTRRFSGLQSLTRFAFSTMPVDQLRDTLYVCLTVSVHDVRTSRRVRRFVDSRTRLAATILAVCQRAWNGPARPPIKISQLAYLISRLLIYRPAPDGFPRARAFLPVAGAACFSLDPVPDRGRSISRLLLHLRALCGPLRRRLR